MGRCSQKSFLRNKICRRVDICLRLNYIKFNDFSIEASVKLERTEAKEYILDLKLKLSEKEVKEKK